MKLALARRAPDTYGSTMIHLTALMSLFVASALADPALGVPSAPYFGSDGTVGVTVVTSAELHKVEAALSDPAARLRMVPNVVKVDELGRYNGCVDLRVTTNGLGSTYVYDTRSCRTADGWRETMIRSEDLDDVTTTWVLHKVAQGVEIRYESRVVTGIPVPASVVSRLHASAMVETLEKLIAFVGR